MTYTINIDVAKALQDAIYALSDQYNGTEGKWFRKDVKKRITEILENSDLIDPNANQMMFFKDEQTD